MSRELDIDDKIELWFPAFKAVSKGEKPSCPRCGSGDMNVIANDMGNNTGYVVITCNDCNKSGYISRVDFSKYKGNVEHIV